ncbi:MAG: hypothetical protein ABJA79_10420 [Parafilimonas sp.]
MFNLFKSNEAIIKTTDKIWKNKQGKYSACLNQSALDEEIFFILWFEDTVSEMDEFFSSKGNSTNNILFYREVNAMNVRSKKIIFAEHYPLYNKEQEIFKKLKISKAIVYSSLDEPLFASFGSSQIISLMEKMGMNDDETLENNMISKAIKNLQQKIKEKVIAEVSARSMGEWFANNYNL